MPRRRLGSIDQRPDGRFRARLAGVTIGHYDTEEQAEQAIALFADVRAAEQPTVGMSLRSWGKRWLEARELDEVHRDTKNDGYVWSGRIATAAFADQPLPAITTKDVRDWVKLQLRTPYQRKNRKGDPIGKPKTPERQTVKNALNLLRSCLQGACEENLIEQNPAAGVLVPKKARTTVPWTWLQLHEIDLLTGEQVDEQARDVFAFAIYTGLREGELFGLQWADVDLVARKASIRHSWKGKPTKPGVTRELHLFGPAVDVLRRQKKRTGGGLYVFACVDGEPYSKGYDANVASWLLKVGVKRKVRFHDLRHTCASHLVSGSWGRAWTIEEVAQHLGHSTSATARRYAHLSPEGITRAVRETRPELRKAAVSRDVSTSVQATKAKLRKLAEEKGFEPPVGCPTPVFKKGDGTSNLHGLHEPGHIRDIALGLLHRFRTEKYEADEQLARLAIEVLENPPPLTAAAQRFVRAIGTPDEAMAAVALLELLLLLATSVEQLEKGALP